MSDATEPESGGVPESVRRRVEELRREILEANRRYYAEDDPYLSDFEWD